MRQTTRLLAMQSRSGQPYSW